LGTHVLHDQGSHRGTGHIDDGDADIARIWDRFYDFKNIFRRKKSAK
jgi:hypothetical protein